MLSPEQLAVTKAIRKLLRDKRGAGFCATCLIKQVGRSSLWSPEDAQRAADALFASPGQFAVTTVCVGCGDGVNAMAIMAVRRRARRLPKTAQGRGTAE
jgi:hypothetical protein